jgi:hypothetical protein
MSFTNSDSHLDELAAALHFDIQALGYNREGYLTPAQIAQFKHHLDRSYWPLLAFLSSMAFVLGGLAVVFLPVGLVLFVPVALLMLTALWGGTVLRRERALLTTPVVRPIMITFKEGTLRRRRRGPSGEEPPLRVQGKQLKAPRTLYRALRANQPYRVYYVPLNWPGYRIVSVEPVPENE